MSVIVATSLGHALDALTQHPDAQLLAGGTDLMVEVNFGHRRPGRVVALRAVPELAEAHIHDGVASLGACTTYARLEHGELAAALPALAQASRTVGSPQIRAAGTIGGNLGTCSPAGDTLPVLAALDATVTMRSTDGTRTMPVEEFMVGVKRTALQPGELVERVDVPVLPGWQGYAKVGTRNAMVIAVASVCLAVDAGAVRVALGSVGPTAIRCRDAEAWLAGDHDPAAPVTPDLAAEFGRRVAAEARPIDDHRSTAAYRRHAVGVLAARLLQRAFPEGRAA